MSKIVIINDPNDQKIKLISESIELLLFERHPSLWTMLKHWLYKALFNQVFWLGRLRYYFDEKTIEMIVVGSRFLLGSENPNKNADYDFAICMSIDEFKKTMLYSFCKDISNEYNIRHFVYRIKFDDDIINGSHVDLQIIDPKDWEMKCTVEELVKIMYRFLVQSGRSIPTKSEQRKVYNDFWSFVVNVINVDKRDPCSLYEWFINREV